MGVNIGNGSDPDNIGQNPYSTPTDGTALSIPISTGGITPADAANASTLSKSTALLEGEISPASNPVLSQSPSSNLYTAISDAAKTTVMAQTLMAIQESYARTVNDILDNWNEQIAITNEQNKAAALRSNILNNTINAQRLQDDVVQQGIQKDSIQKDTIKKAETLQELNKPTSQQVHLSTNQNFNDWWNKASSTEKSSYLNEHGQKMVASYLEKINDPIIQNSDLAKTVMPLYVMVIAQTQIINPLAADITMRSPLTDYGTGTSLVDQLGNITVPAILNTIPEVNLLLPGVMFSSAAEASLGLFGKQREILNTGGERKIDDKFVDEFGKRTLANTKNTDSWLRFKESSYENLSDGQKSAIQTCVNLMALTSVLIFDVKSQGAGSNLSKEEFNDILTSGIPGRDVLNQVVTQLNAIFTEVKEKGESEFDQYRYFVEDFISGAGLNRYNLNDLKDFSEVLNYAYQEIRPSDRAVRMPT